MTMSSPEKRDVIVTGTTDASLTSASSSKSPSALLHEYELRQQHPSMRQMLLNNKQQQQQQQQQRPGAMSYQEIPTASSPWTLGSTDGAFVPSRNATGGTAEQDGDGDDSVPEVVNTTTSGAVIAASSGKASQQQQQQHQQHHPHQSLYQERLFRQGSAATEAVLAASCEVMGFDIAEMWLRTGPKTHQLTNSHLRPTALEDSVRKDIVDVYYGDKSSERTHRLSPALCKRAKEAGDVIWVTAHNESGAQVLRCSISNVRTAVAVPVCHEASNTNITIIFFSIRR